MSSLKSCCSHAQFVQLMPGDHTSSGGAGVLRCCNPATFHRTGAASSEEHPGRQATTRTGCCRGADRSRQVSSFRLLAKLVRAIMNPHHLRSISPDDIACAQHLCRHAALGNGDESAVNGSFLCHRAHRCESGCAHDSRATPCSRHWSDVQRLAPDVGPGQYYKLASTASHFLHFERPPSSPAVPVQQRGHSTHCSCN